MATIRFRIAFEAGDWAVCFAVHTPSRYQVLLKFVSSRIAQDPRQWNIARQFVHTVSPIIHAQLQRVFALEDQAGYRFLVLENLNGISMDGQLREVRRLSVSEACRVIRLAASGLAALHERRQVFGEVRSENLWLETSGNVKLVRDNTNPPLIPELSQPGLTPTQIAQAEYLAPELAERGTTLSPLTDLYALGCTFYQLLSGRTPHAGGDVADKLARHATESVEPLLRWSVPDEVAHIVDQLMMKTPAARLADASTVATRLAAFVAATQRSISQASPTATLISFEKALGQPSTKIPPAPPPLVSESDEHPPIVPPPIQPTVPPHMAQEMVSDDHPPSKTRTDAFAKPSTEALPVPPRSRPTDRLRRARQTRRKQAVTLSAFAAALVLIASGYIVLSPSARQALLGRQAARTTSEQKGPVKAEPSRGTDRKTAPPKGDSPQSQGRYAIRRDDGELLWMTPTQGPPIELHHVPPGAQLVLVARAHDLISTDIGKQVLASLGPRFAAMLQSWETAAGFTLDQITRLVVSLHDGDPLPQVSVFVQLRQAQTTQQLRANWGDPKTIDYQEARYYQAGGWTYFITAAEDATQFVMANEMLIREVIDGQDAPAIVRREMGRLLQTSDRDRHVSLLFVPEFLIQDPASRQPLDLAVDPPRVSRAIDWLLGDQVKAALVSLQFAEPFYLELRAYGQSNVDSLAMADSLRVRIGEASEQIEAFFGQFYPSAYWRRVALRFPQMVRFLHKYTRLDVEDDQAVANAVLPGAAAHNLAFAIAMLWDMKAEADTGLPNPPLATPDQPNSIEELVNTRMSLSFDQKSLEFAIRDLADDIRQDHPQLPFTFDIQIAGSDLQLSGITRNQQITHFTATDQTIAEILTSLVLRANPVTTVTNASEADQKLIWVIGPDPTGTDPADPKRQILLITTRDAAERNGYKLPRPFQPE